MLFGAFLVSTIVSTSGAALQSVVANVIRDLYQNFAATTGNDRRTVTLSRLITVAVSVLAAVLAILFPRALDWLVASYAYSASALTAPIFLGYVLRRRLPLTALAAGTSMVAGFAGCGVAQILDTTVPYAVWGIATSIVALLAVALATPASAKKTPAVEGKRVVQQ